MKATGFEKAAVFMAAAGARLVARGKAARFYMGRNPSGSMILSIDIEDSTGDTVEAHRGIDEGALNATKFPGLVARHEFAVLLVTAGMGREEAGAYLCSLDDAGRLVRR